jgi:hypothetical protein
VEDVVRLSFWSDEDRWFVPRALGLGYSLNLKYVAKRLGWIKKPVVDRAPAIEQPSVEPTTREERLRDQIESSKYEDVG